MRNLKAVRRGAPSRQGVVYENLAACGADGARTRTLLSSGSAVTTQPPRHVKEVIMMMAIMEVVMVMTVMVVVVTGTGGPSQQITPPTDSQLRKAWHTF